MDLSALVDLILAYGWPWGVFLAIGYAAWRGFLIFLDPDKSDLWRGRFYAALYQFSKKRDHEKKYISNDVKGRLNLARRQLHFGPSVLPTAVDIDWVDGADPEAYNIADDEFVVRLDPAVDQDQNIVFLAAEMVRHTSLIGTRRVINPALQRALDFTTTRNLLEFSNHQRSIDTFYNEYFRPAVENDDQLKRWTNPISEIDERGLYATLLLVELEEFGKAIEGLKLRPYMVKEVEDLVDFVHSVATKGLGEDVPLEFIRGTTAVGITLVAKTKTILEKGIDPYVQAAKINIDKGADALYLIIWRRPDLKNAGIAKWRAYKSKTEGLADALKNLDSTEWHFSADYSYVDLDGERREGQIHRFRVHRNGE